MRVILPSKTCTFKRQRPPQSKEQVVVMTRSFFLDDFWFMLTFCAASCLHHKDTKFTKGFKIFWMLFFVIFVTVVVDKSKL